MMRAVTTHYDEALPPVLANITLDVRRGEIFGLVGPVGSGKSTTLKILAGRLVPTYGKVNVFGRSPRRRAIKARIGYMPEPAGRPPKAHRVGVLGFLSKAFGWRRLQPGSAVGQPLAQRRAALAQALLKNLDILMFDEPFAGFDPVGCTELKELMLTLARRGKTVIVSGGSLIDLKDICSRIAVLYGGRLEAVGTIEELVAKPGAVRSLAPTVSAPALDRLLEIIRQDLTSEKGRVGLSEQPIENVFVSELPLGASSPIADPIDHKRLAELTQPSAANPPKAVGKN